MGNENTEDTGNGCFAFLMVFMLTGMIGFFTYQTDNRLVRIECATGLKPHTYLKITEDDCTKIGRE